MKQQDVAIKHSLADKKIDKNYLHFFLCDMK